MPKPVKKITGKEIDPVFTNITFTFYNPSDVEPFRLPEEAKKLDTEKLKKYFVVDFECGSLQRGYPREALAEIVTGLVYKENIIPILKNITKKHESHTSYDGLRTACNILNRR